ncbi:hypothetical protein EYR40_003168 [Pleurotus pulmonarius]|nr:hypothetical protein EYR40_003168 [Pleurotus pulmonarius]
MLDARFAAFEAKVDTKLSAVEGKLDTNCAALDMRFSGFQKKVEDLETKLGILEATSNKLEAIIRDLATKFGDINTEVTSNKEFISSVLIMAIRALNGLCGNGFQRNYQEVPFLDGTYPSRVENGFPHIRTIADLENIAPITVQAYLSKCGVPFDDFSEQACRFELGRCIGINEEILSSRLGS